MKKGKKQKRPSCDSMKDPMPDKLAVVAFEHEALYVGHVLTPGEFKALARFHDKVDSRFYDVGYEKIKLGHYVGIIRVAGRTIEILPKADKSTGGEGKEKARWRRALLEMLAISGSLNLSMLDKAPQRADSPDLLSILINRFISEADNLVREGLLKDYRSESNDVAALKGRLIFSRHIAKNITKPDRWYTEHIVYDRNTKLNGIVRCAIDILVPFCPSAFRDSLRALCIDFDGITSYVPDKDFIDEMKLNRRTERYRNVLELAWLIIQHRAPDFVGGELPVLAILFDMNLVYERTVANLLIKESRIRRPDIQVLPQETKPFWRRHYLNPDIVLRRADECVVIDTKWKTDSTEFLSDQDLRQIFTYGIYFKASRVVLLFPQTGVIVEEEQCFSQADAIPEYSLLCSIKYANLITSEGKINRNFAGVFLNSIFTYRVP